MHFGSVLGSRVHPRGGGEQTASASLSGEGDGSSPRGRVTVSAIFPVDVACRFNPAGAGNRLLSVIGMNRATVHPRGGGEQVLAVDHGEKPVGSSPRGRGTATHNRAIKTVIRFIPAGAGNRASVAPLRWFAPVHPRGGEEQLRDCIPSDPLGGSSPRGRGTAPQAATSRCWTRFIPAGAGNRPRWNTSTRPPTVHPRGGGEQALTKREADPNSGSSPRGRGTVPLQFAGRVANRFIPTGAGNSWLNNQ